ncbi:MAG: Na(+)-translocating NADH-quinone reductase subunit A [Paludibacter sp.]|nr:Na(+)-translocating NADH-quinone reductase subunit A [Paludibacter sp.]
MANLIKTKRGLDIQISGKAKEIIGNTLISDVVALIPDHYHGITPKIIVKEGDTVKAGAPVFHDKTFSEMNFVAPVSGKIIAVNRGERRKVMSITIAPDAKIDYEIFKSESIVNLNGEEIKSKLLTAGIWPFIKQRPYDVIANPTKSPKAIFISSFDSAPLAPNYEFVLEGQFSDFQTGIDALAKMTEGKVHLGIKAGSKSTDFRSTKNVEITEYEGPHPIGNTGIQINQLDPINKGEVVWTVNALDVLFIGRYFNKGIVDFSRTIALTGPEVQEPQYYKTIIGTAVEPIIKGKVTTQIPLRYVSGNVLNGIKVEANGYLDPYASQITVIDEGNETHEMFGWAMPRFDKFSTSKSYFSGIVESKIFQSIFGKVNYKYDARLLGGVRAIIMSGEYDKVLPMDILPEFLIKAMIAGNIDKMEALGGYEIAPEDVALCEFVCTSKLPLQSIVRRALDTMKSELE